MLILSEGTGHWSASDQVFRPAVNWASDYKIGWKVQLSRPA
jgi:hypothetical protein